MIRLFRLFLLLGLVVAPTLGHAAFVWSFTNSGQVYGTTESIPLEAQLTNTGTSSIVVDLNVGGFGQGFVWGTFPSQAYPQPGEYDIQLSAFDYFDNAVIQPGESRDFIFGVLTPVGTIAPGIYTSGEAYLSINGGLSISAGTTQFDFTPEYFVANVGSVPNPVPVPAAFWLLGSGLLGLLGLSRHRGHRNAELHSA
jgi:hypothetical protein